MEDNILSSLFDDADVSSILKGGTLGYGVIAIAIPIIQFWQPLTEITPTTMIYALYGYLFINGIGFMYLFGKHKFLNPKPICPKCKQLLQEIEISTCPNCNTKINTTTSLKCPNCGIIDFQK
jgi:hypothetical protein